MSIRKVALAIITTFFLAFPAFSEDEGRTTYVFELPDDAAEVVETKEEEPVFLQGYIELNNEKHDDDILLETDFSPKYRVNNIKKVSTYSKSLKSSDGNDFRLQKGNFSLSSSSYSYNDSNTLVKNVRQNFGATYEKNFFSLTGGLETTYGTGISAGASRGAYITPKLKLNNRTSISFKNKINQDATKYDTLLGIDYVPKYIKNSSIWLGGGTTFRNNAVESQTLNLKTNFYIF